jgi:hypothetical protein
LLRLASADQVGSLLSDGRLSAPTGYFNSTAALFTIGALTATALASRRELPGLLRGVLIGMACADLQLSVLPQSRGWLFTLPLVLLVAVIVAPERLRFVAAALFPAIATLLPVHKLIAVFGASSSSALDHAARSAGRESLVLCTVMLVLATLVAWTEKLVPARSLSRRGRLGLGAGLTVLVLAGGTAGAIAATHGDPISFVKRQWQGFSNQTTAAAHGSYFATVGSGRYDFWRVALDALAAHPVGGLGQDNFADYYVVRRHTKEEPQWVHSFELRLLASTGIVGLALFTVFMVAAIAAALGARRRGNALARAAAGIALLPLAVWLIHGSVDWFWEVPALSGPALGFLGLAGALGSVGDRQAGQGGAEPRSEPRRRIGSASARAVATLGFVAAVAVLAFPYLSVRETSLGSDTSLHDPAAALRDLARAAKLNPLNAAPGRLAGAIALQTGDFKVAEQRFDQATSREPGGWFSWLGAGLAASALGDPSTASRDFLVARSINSLQPAVTEAVARVHSRHPLTTDEAFRMLVVVG